MISYLYFPLMRSAAFRKMAARSANGNVSHADFADSAESIAVLTFFGLAFAYLATTSACEAGLGWLAREEASDCGGSCQLLNVQ